MLCYAVYFLRFLGSKEAAKKGFPLHGVADLLPCRADGEVSVSAHLEVLQIVYFVKIIADFLHRLFVLKAAGGLDSGPAHVELLPAVLPEADPDGGRALRHDLPERPQLRGPGCLRYRQQPGLHGGALHLPAH